jgi:alkylation response protein AidB-like acyl-CoA dehydrogenase
MDARTNHLQTSFDLTAEQRAIGDMARGFAADRVAPNALEWDKQRHFPRDVIVESAALGMAGIYVGEEYGGSALGRLDAVVLFEALAEACPAFSAFLSIHNMVAWMIASSGTPAQKKRYLPKLASGEWLGSYALTEPGSGSDAAALKTRAMREGNHYLLDGSKQFISGAGENDVYVCMVRTGGDGPKGVSALIVDKDTPGLSFGALENKMGWHMQPTAQVIFQSCRVPVENLLASEGAGFRIAMAGLDGGRLNIAACSLGGAQSALDKALAYARERTAFGSPVAGFQAQQFRLADMETELQAARALLYGAAARLDTGAPDSGKWSAMAKRFVTDTGFSVANDALQIHGGYGYLHDYGIEKIVRDLRVHQILEGTNDIMRLIVARHMLGR